jgi:hypothetical protein
LVFGINGTATEVEIRRQLEMTRESSEWAKLPDEEKIMIEIKLLRLHAGKSTAEDILK